MSSVGMISASGDRGLLGTAQAGKGISDDVRKGEIRIWVRANDPVSRVRLVRPGDKRLS